MQLAYLSKPFLMNAPLFLTPSSSFVNTHESFNQQDARHAR